jgi:putative sterol carrier protein
LGQIFLSDGWFDEVQRITEAAGDLQIPDSLKDLKINLEVSGAPQGTVEAHIAGGGFAKGSADGAPTKLKLSYDLAMKLFIEQDQSAGMQAFMSGQIQVEGDMGKLMAMQGSGGPSDGQKKVSEQIREMTETS